MVCGEGQRRQKGQGKKGKENRRRLVHLCTLSVPEPFDPPCLLIVILLCFSMVMEKLLHENSYWENMFFFVH